MLRIVLILAVAFAALLPLQAQGQEQPPDYQIIVLRQPSYEDGLFSVTYGIYNIGGDAGSEATVILTVATTGEQLGIRTVPPVPARGTETVTFEFAPPESFEPGSLQSLQASVGIDEIERRGAPTISNNSVRTALTVPSVLEPPSAVDDETEADAEADSPGFTIPILDVEPDLTNPGHILILVGVAGSVLVLLWVAFIILRLIFEKPATMGAWQPPYAALTMLDPDSVQGRRQLWQQHAQSDALLEPCAEGTYHIRKLLLGTDGTLLSGWRPTALRLSQYDMYGRVARTHTLASSGLVNRLNKAAHRRHPLTEEQALKAVRPIAKKVIAQFEKRMSKKNAMLPVALDARFRGTHGEARILFELFGCRRGEWELIDQWEPEMIVIRGAIHENFTYSMFGQQPGEDYKTFRRRLEDEMAQTLAEMITRQRATMEEIPVAPRVETPSAERWMPQDTAPHPPMA